MNYERMWTIMRKSVEHLQERFGDKQTRIMIQMLDTIEKAELIKREWETSYDNAMGAH